MYPYKSIKQEENFMKNLICMILLCVILISTLTSCGGNNTCGACNGSGYYQKKTCPICKGSGHSYYDPYK